MPHASVRPILLGAFFSLKEDYRQGRLIKKNGDFLLTFTSGVTIFKKFGFSRFSPTFRQTLSTRWPRLHGGREIERTARTLRKNTNLSRQSQLIFSRNFVKDHQAISCKTLSAPCQKF